MGDKQGQGGEEEGKSRFFLKYQNCSQENGDKIKEELSGLSTKEYSPKLV